MANLPSFFRKAIPSSPTNFFNDVAEKQRRLESYKKTWQAYLAELPNPLVVDGDVDDNVKVSPIRSAIEVGVYFLFGDEVRFEISPNATTELDIENDGGMPDYLKDLNRIWKANRKKSLMHEIGLSGGIHGDCFVKLLPSGAGLKGDLPRIILLDPANVDVTLDQDDCHKVEKFTIEYNTQDAEGKTVTRTQEIVAVYASDAVDAEEETQLVADSPPIS